jgi:hypothetical protein
VADPSFCLLVQGRTLPELASPAWDLGLRHRAAGTNGHGGYGGEHKGCRGLHDRSPLLFRLSRRVSSGERQGVFSVLPRQEENRHAGTALTTVRRSHRLPVKRHGLANGFLVYDRSPLIRRAWIIRARERYRWPPITVKGPNSGRHASATARAEAPLFGPTPLGCRSSISWQMLSGIRYM